MTTLVRDLMRSGLITCAKVISLGEAAALLTRHRVHALVVVDDAGRAAFFRISTCWPVSGFRPTPRAWRRCGA